MTDPSDPVAPDNGPVFDDGSEVVVETPQEDPPRSGQWADAEPSNVPLTEDEAALGRYLGEAIDVEDDDDNGEVAADELRAAVEGGL